MTPELPLLEVDACQQLAHAVIKRATLDRYHIDERIRQDAHFFVFSPKCTRIRQLWCELAGITEHQLQNRWIEAEEYDRLMKQQRGQAA